MITRIIQGMKYNRWNKELAKEVLKDIIYWGRQNAKQHANKQKIANGEAVTLGCLKKSKDNIYKKKDKQLLYLANIQKLSKEIPLLLWQRKTRKPNFLDAVIARYSYITC